MSTTSDVPSVASTDGGSAASIGSNNSGGAQPSHPSNASSSSSMSNTNITSATPTSTTTAAANNITNSTNINSGVSSSSLDSQIERLKRCEYLRENEVKALCLRAREILVDEGNVQRVDAPVTVCCLVTICCFCNRNIFSVLLFFVMLFLRRLIVQSIIPKICLCLMLVSQIHFYFIHNIIHTNTTF